MKKNEKRMIISSLAIVPSSNTSTFYLYQLIMRAVIVQNCIQKMDVVSWCDKFN